MMRKIMVVMIVLFTLIAFSACEKDEVKITSMKDLKVSEDFTFSTVRAVKLMLTSVDADQAVVPNAPFSISREPDKLILNGKTNSEGSFEFTITVPSYERELTLNYGTESTILTIPQDGEISHLFIAQSGKSKDTLSFFTPAEGEYGSLCFEDLWPSNGDYDINDLVLDFNVEEQYDGDTWELTNLIFKYKLRATGARRLIGFATTLPDYIVATGVPVSSNGLASWVDEHNTLVFFDNARDVVNDDPAEFYNTDHGQPHIADAEIVHEITLPVTEDWGKGSKMVFVPWYSAPFNPFIFINHNQSYQIHLKHYPVIPSYMNMDLFNTEDDYSDVSYPDYPESFQNDNYQPWAFYIAESVSYPHEYGSILRAFPDFAAWALSDGFSHQDWYLNPDPSYIYDPNH
jgi:LruC domain-containing protein